MMLALKHTLVPSETSEFDPDSKPPNGGATKEFSQKGEGN
jgi:hypothetical protein